jgi:hypothetical protein
LTASSWTLPDLARRLQLSEWSLSRRCERGEIRGFRTKAGQWRVETDEVARLLVEAAGAGTAGAMGFGSVEAGG